MKEWLFSRVKRLGFFGAEVQDALAILATLEGILPLQDDERLRLEAHVAACARASGGRNDGLAWAAAANESITRQNLRLNALGEFVGLGLQLSDAFFDGGSGGIDFALICLDARVESIVFSFVFGVSLFGFVDRFFEFGDFFFELSNDALEVFDFAFERRIIAGICHGVELVVGVVVAFLRTRELGHFVIQEGFRIVELSRLLLERHTQIGKEIAISLDFSTFLVDIHAKRFLRQIDLLEID